jgi:nucleoside 2-deoxyribosyltransferase
MKKVYISGAIAGHVLAERKAAFKAAERELAEMGFSPVNPFDNGVPDEAHWRAHMRADIALLVQCDMIYMLRGWELSKGAKLEHDVATSCGIKVLKYE